MLTVISGVGSGVMPEASRVCASHLPVRQGQQARTGCIATDWLHNNILGKLLTAVTSRFATLTTANTKIT